MLSMGLSMLFTGMAIKRLFDGIARSSISTYMKIMEASSATARQMNPAYQGAVQLGAAFEFLKFVVADTLFNALLPFLPALLEFVTNIAEFVSKNPEVVFIGIATWLGAILAMVAGQSMLAFIGFLEFATKIGGAGIFTKTPWETMKGGISGVNTSFSNLGNNPVFQSISAWALTGLAINFAFKDASDAYKAFEAGNISSGIVQALSSVAGGAAGVFAATGNLKGAGALIGITFGLEMVDKAINGPGGINIIDAISGALVAIGSGVMYVNPGIGGALIAIGFALRFIDIENQDAIDSKLKLLGYKKGKIGLEYQGGSGTKIENIPSPIDITKSGIGSKMTNINVGSINYNVSTTQQGIETLSQIKRSYSG
jgi:hypothetical protein